ncbi:spore maturation protein [Paludicola sp. MB14-C6]|uniref:spore maturation protein n=1 Tax=Paludihabitans sp. MB14-C6 TaxID=3070656 RepID=UPI0027DBEA61|nr:nucleoside recognition domain-containing protein [Paludicola sp. MB14-C6]WMJ24124.1 spore maturation protein [Paludicola sp. MB14-C6]
MINFIIPCFFGFILIYGMIKKVDIFDEFIAGAKEGLTTSIRILPTLIILMTCVGMFKVSGGIDLITYAIQPITSLFHIPNEIIPLALLRPISGSGALCIYKDVLVTNGPDSLVGRIASVLMGSTETTFYTIAVYYGATQIKKTRHTLACSLTGDLVGFIMSSLLVYLLFY